jgi:cyclic beta-1,2-glucan synthetase
MQRLGVESVLGVRIQGSDLYFCFCIPRTWSRFEITVRYRSARYLILVENADGVSRGILSARLDAVVISQRPLWLPLLDDGNDHTIHVWLG